MKTETELLNFISEKIKETSSPFYVYETNIIRDHCRRFLEIPYKNKSIHFATMANSNPEFLRIIKEEGVNVFVNSEMHLQRVIETGFSSDQIVFTASAMDPSTFQIIHDSKVIVNLDSPAQLSQWKNLFPGIPVGIRCNIGSEVLPKNTHAGYFIGNESRLGFSEEEIRAVEGDHMIKGLHMYVGTDILDVDYFIRCYSKLCELVKKFPNLEFVDFGGGFGVDEAGEVQFDFETYNQRLCELLNKVNSNISKELRLILEPGRIIGGNAGYFVCRVTDVKERTDRRFVGVNASSVQFPRPLLYPDIARHPVEILQNGREINHANLKNTFITGCSTYSRDYLAKDVRMPDVFIGDHLILGNAGSYSASSYTQFLGFPKPQEFFL